jgi:DNA-binding winged helix-turn-helix (wHTH) protein/Tol biopolymer transport system component
VKVLKVAMNPTEGAVPLAFAFGPFRVDLARHQLLRDGEPILLTAKAWETLVLLLGSGGRVVEKDEILSTVWPDAFVSEDSLTQAISVLRKAMGDDSSQPIYIATVPRRGYRFVADVAVEHPRALPPVTPPPAPVEALLPSGSAAAGDARSAMYTDPAAGPAITAAPVRSWSALWWAVPAVIALALVARTVSVAPRGGPTGAPIRFLQLAPEGSMLASGGILSPDGRYLAFVAQDVDSGKSQLWLRGLETPSPEPLPGTDGAFRPFWSPDSRSIGFFAEGKLKRIGVTGVPPQTLASVGYLPSGGSWSSRGVIIYSDRLSRIFAVPEQGGAAAPVTTLDPRAGEVGHSAPQFLPDGASFLFYAVTSTPAASGTYVGSLDSTERVQLLDGTADNVIFAPPGYLLYVRDNVLMAQRFDTAALRVTGAAMTVSAANAAREEGEARVGALSASANGLLTFGGDRPESRLTWFSRTGARLDEISAMPNIHNPMISPDGRYLVANGGPSGGIWLVDLQRGSPTRVSDVGNLASWSHDGSRVTFTGRRVDGQVDIEARPVNGRAEDAQVLVRNSEMKISGNWTADGSYFTYAASNPQTRLDLWMLPGNGDAPRPFLQTAANEMQPQVSPDGRWLAYASDESGTWEVYVQSFPAPGEKRTVSVGGGAQPQWRRDGRELFYLSPDGTLMAVDVTTGGTFEAGRPQRLFRAPIASDIISYRNQYAVSEDGGRFVIDLLGDRDPINVVVNWNALVNP